MAGIDRAMNAMAHYLDMLPGQPNRPVIEALGERLKVLPFSRMGVYAHDEGVVISVTGAFYNDIDGVALRGIDDDLKKIRELFHPLKIGFGSVLTHPDLEPAHTPSFRVKGLRTTTLWYGEINERR